MTFFAHHSGMLQSSVAELGLVPYLVFQWLLERCDEEGVVCDVRPRVIARDLAVLHESLFTPDAVEQALRVLQQPDDASKRREHDGRRIIPNEALGSSYVVVTYRYYNEEWAEERRRKKAAKRQRRQRAKVGKAVTPVTQPSRAVTPRHADVTPCHATVTLSNGVSSEDEQETEAKTTSSMSADDDGVSAAIAVAMRVVHHVPVGRRDVETWLSEFGRDGWAIAGVLLEREGRFTNANSKEYLKTAIRNAFRESAPVENFRDYVEHRLRTPAASPTAT